MAYSFGAPASRLAASFKKDQFQERKAKQLWQTNRIKHLPHLQPRPLRRPRPRSLRRRRRPRTRVIKGIRAIRVPATKAVTAVPATKAVTAVLVAKAVLVAVRAGKVVRAAVPADLAAASASFSVRRKSASSVSKRWISSTKARRHSFPVCAGARQDSASPHDWSLRASPALARRGHQARPQHRVAAVCWQRRRQHRATRRGSRQAAASGRAGPAARFGLKLSARRLRGRPQPDR